MSSLQDQLLGDVLDQLPCDRCHQVHLTAEMGPGSVRRPSCVRHKSRRAEDGSLVPCQGFRMKHLDVCRVHGGKTPQARARQDKAVATEQRRKALTRAVRVFGVPRQVDPAQGLIEEYWRTAGLVDAYERLVSQLTEEEISFGIVTERTKTVMPPFQFKPDGKLDEEAPTPEIETVVTRSARPHILVAMFNQERDRFSKLGAEIVRLELETRRDEYVRAQVDVFANVIGQLGLTPAQALKAAGLLRALDQRAPASIDGEVV